MAEEIIPAIEAQDDEPTEEVAHYECAFHILPTVADEEAQGVVDGLKSLVTRSGGVITDGEVPERYDLVYDIIEQVEGVNRRFNAAHFGWMRFTLVPAALSAYDAEIRQKPEILRYLVVRLAREEAQKPFSVFETRRVQARSEAASRKKIDDADETGKVSEEALDQSLEKMTAG